MGKRHHYVPRFYLNRFASAPRRIHIFNLERRLTVQDASLRDQCWAHRLYGPDDSLERDIAIVEQGAALVLRRILESGAPPQPHSDDHSMLLGFLALQLSRTLAARAHTQRMSALLGNAAFDGSPPEDWTLSPAQAMDLALGSVGTMRSSLWDLRLLLVAAGGKDEFITSDNPVVKYNQYCEGIKYFGVTGTACAGFQLYYPLSRHVALMLFDGGVYAAGNRRNRETVEATPEDVVQLNRLQMMSASSNVYFGIWSTRKTLPQLLNSVRKQRGMDRPHVNVATSDSDPMSELLHQYWPMPQLDLRLSFLSIKRNARRVPLFARARAMRPPYATPREADREGTSETFTSTRRI